MPTINFTTKLSKIGAFTILHLPKAASAKLPSRGMTLVDGTFNGKAFKTVLEPDGKGSHWFQVKGKPGDTAKVSMTTSKDWPEPEIPPDIQQALKNAPKSLTTWKETTAMARWDWIRWIRATNSADTRKKRIGVALSKLKSGMRRPCCFNRAMCTEPAVSKGGVMLDAK